MTLPRTGQLINENGSTFRVVSVHHRDRWTQVNAEDTGNPAHTISRYYPDHG